MSILKCMGITAVTLITVIACAAEEPAAVVEKPAAVVEKPYIFVSQSQIDFTGNESSDPQESGCWFLCRSPIYILTNLATRIARYSCPNTASRYVAVMAYDVIGEISP